MAIQYTFQITGARVTEDAGKSDVVKQLDYTLTGTDSGCTFSLPASALFGAPGDDSFIEFDALTPEQMVAWIEALPETASLKQHIAQVLAKEVEKAALTEKPLPWAPAPVDPAEGVPALP